MPRRYRRSRSRRSGRRYGSRRRGFKRGYRRNRRVRYRRRRFVKGGFPGFFKKVKLQFEDTTQTKLVLGLATNPFNFATYNLNGAYDVIPALGNTACPGFNEWATVYSRYQVTYVRLTTTFSMYATNNPCYCGVFLRPVFAEGGLSSWQGWRNLWGNPLPHKRILMSSGDSNKGRATLSIGMPIWKLWGSKAEYYASGNFSAAVGANPQALLQGFVYVLSGDGTPMDLEVTTATTMTMYIKFYHKRTLFV